MNTNDLEKVFKQARSEYGSVNIDGDGYQACVYLGVKITKDDMTGEIKIYDPQKSVNYYVEIDKGLYSLFINKGWLGAVIDITLSKYKEKLGKNKRKYCWGNEWQSESKKTQSSQRNARTNFKEVL